MSLYNPNDVDIFHFYRLIVVTVLLFNGNNGKVTSFHDEGCLVVCLRLVST